MLKKVQMVTISLTAALVVNYMGSWWQTARFGSSEYLVLMFFKLSAWQLRQIGVPIVFVVPIVTFIIFLFVPVLIKKSIKLRSFQFFTGTLLLLMLLPYISARPLDNYLTLITWGSGSSNIVFEAVIYGITILLCLVVFFLGKLQYMLASKKFEKR